MCAMMLDPIASGSKVELSRMNKLLSLIQSIKSVKSSSRQDSNVKDSNSDPNDFKMAFTNFGDTPTIVTDCSLKMREINI